MFKETKISLSGNPVSGDMIYKKNQKGFIYLSQTGKNRKLDYQWQAKSQFKGAPTKEELEIEVKYYCVNKRRRDMDNLSKLFTDSLQGIVYENDCQITKDSHEMFVDPENPRIEITLRERKGQKLKS
jgi:Holliday junction resolvase RusA-like endonuclease